MFILSGLHVKEYKIPYFKACTDAGYIIDDGAGLAGTTGERLARKKAEHLQDSASKSDLENMPVSNKMCKRKNTRQWFVL